MGEIGLLHLHTRHGLPVPPPLTGSYVHRGAARTDRIGQAISQYFPPAYEPQEADRHHLEFSLKWEPLDLRVLSAWCRLPAAADEVLAFLREKPTGENARRLWFLCEWLTGTRLDCADGTPRNYVPLLDPDRYVVTSAPARSRRHHVENNLLGPPLLCPVVRRTPELDALVAYDFPAAIARLVPDADLKLLHRAVSSLSLKETRSSFEIEGETLSANRHERFVAQLEEVSRAETVSRDELLRWQQELVDPRYAATGYRTDQVYVAEGSRAGRLPRLHYVAPRPADVDRLMEQFFELDAVLAGAPPIVHAAAWPFAFVFVHPFGDGNGRLHRLLIHNVLRRRRITPDRVVLPVSAVIVHDRAQYDAVLESFYRPVMAALAGRYKLDDAEVLTVEGDTVDLYRSFDATPMVEAVGRWMRRALESELVEEIAWLRRYDRTRAALRDIVDMPDKKLRTFIAIVEDNDGRLAKGKRGQFAELSDEELRRMEEAVQEHLLGPG
ncbi:MAG: Fic family protein [Deltaproteobacteria bacterium]|nr:Fic family protein [Deltaproteobacteria bacterium]